MNEQLKAMRALLAAVTDPSDKAEIQAEIDKVTPDEEDKEEEKQKRRKAAAQKAAITRRRNQSKRLPEENSRYIYAALIAKFLPLYDEKKKVMKKRNALAKSDWAEQMRVADFALYSRQHNSALSPDFFENFADGRYSDKAYVDQKHKAGDIYHAEARLKLAKEMAVKYKDDPVLGPRWSAEIPQDEKQLQAFKDRPVSPLGEKYPEWCSLSARKYKLDKKIDEIRTIFRFLNSLNMNTRVRFGDADGGGHYSDLIAVIVDGVEYKPRKFLADLQFEAIVLR